MTGLSDDAALVRAVARADRISFESLYGRYARRVHQYARTFVRDHSLAEEIVIDTMLAVWQGAGRFDGNSRASTWILGIARHKALDAVRRRRAAGEADDLDSVPEPACEEPGTEEHALQTASGQQLRAALEQLTASHREVLWLAFFEDLGYADIARLLEVPLNTVKTRVFHAKQKLRSLLDSPAIVAREA